MALKPGGKYLSDTVFNWWHSKQNRRYNINDGPDTYDRENYECESTKYYYNNDCDNDDTNKESVLCGVVMKHNDIGYKASDCNTTKPFICQIEILIHDTSMYIILNNCECRRTFSKKNHVKQNFN
ncbi:unnamed protein product, partial [Leptidea sinapis]